MNEVLNAPYFVPNLRVTYIDHEHRIPVGSQTLMNQQTYAGIRLG